MMQNHYKTRTDTRVMIHRKYIIPNLRRRRRRRYIYIPIIFCCERGHYRARSLTDDGLRRDLR